MIGNRAVRPLVVAALTLRFALGCVSSSEAAGALSVQAELDRREVSVDEAATLTVTVTAAGLDLPKVSLPPIRGARVERLGESQGFSWINGRVTRTSTTAFRLHPSAEGQITIPPIRVAGSGTEAESAPLSLRVGKSPSSTSAPGTELFARLTLDRNRVYWNEGVTARFTLYSRAHLEGAPAWDPPDAAGFWSEVLGAPRTGVVMIGGLEYDATELRVAYFPTRTGRLSIGPGRVHLQVLRRFAPPDPWSSLGIPETQVEEVTLRTEQARVEVLSLPDGAPPTFRGAVGDFSLDVRVDRVAIGAGEPVTVTTTVRGRGNVASAGDPEITGSPPARMYAGGAGTLLDRSGDRLRGERRREVTFVPDTVGTFHVLPARFSWFDPESERYRTQVSDTIQVRVFPAGVALDSLHPQSGGRVIASLRTKAGWRGSLSLDPSPGTLAVTIASVLAYAGLLGALRVRERAERDPKRRRRKSLEVLLAELSALEKSEAEARPGAIQIARVIQRALEVRYAVDVEGRPLTETMERVRSAGASSDELNDLARLFDALDRVAYAPVRPGFDELSAARIAADGLLRRYLGELS